MTRELTRPDAFTGAWRSDELARAVYAESAGIMRLWPQAVAQPIDIPDLQCLVEWAAAENMPLIPRGNGSSMSGAAVGDGVIVDLHNLSWIDPASLTGRTVRCGPAATRNRIETAAGAVGLRFPVDPSSGAFASIGGMVSTNAAGARTLKFGAMRRWVRAIDCVFADGTRAEIRRGAPLPDSPSLHRWAAVARDVLDIARTSTPRSVRKESSGYALHAFAHSQDVIDLLVGSEGTLAFNVGIELDLLACATCTSTVLTSWADLDQAVAGAAHAREAGATACEILDHTFLSVAARGTTLPFDEKSACAILVELEDSDPASVKARAATMGSALSRLGATSVAVGVDIDAEERLWSIRHAASATLARLDPDLRSMQLIEDGCVPPDRLADYVRGVRAAFDAHAVRGVIFGHAGDANVHVNLLIDVRHEGWITAAKAVFDDVTSLTERLGGTMAGEHGDGRLRTGQLSKFFGPAELKAFSIIKSAFDPSGILNPGVKVGTPPDPFAHIKYSADLTPALPAAARSALDHVERERSYAMNRLEMIGPSG